MKKRKKYILSFSAVLALTALSLFIMKKSNIELKVITLEEFQRCVDNNVSDGIYVYVGRNTCPSCDVVYPELCKISRNSGVNILYYNTEQDRHTNTDEMNSFLGSLGVDEVPTVIRLRDGEVIEKYTGEDFINLYKR